MISHTMIGTKVLYTLKKTVFYSHPLPNEALIGNMKFRGKDF